MRKYLIFALLLCLLLPLCACSRPIVDEPAGEAESGTALPEEPDATEAADAAEAADTPAPGPENASAEIAFAARSVPADTEELRIVLQPGETALLEGLPALRRLDASGSACYEELCAWGAAHPEVALRYTLPLPGLAPVGNRTSRLDLTGLSREEILAGAELLPYLPALEKLSLPGGEEGLALEEALAIARSLPDTLIAYPFTIYGQEADLSDKALVLFHIPVDDQGELVRQVLPCMRACTWLDMDSCGVDNRHMAVIRDENPEVEVIWRVWFGDHYSVRTNVTKILASMPTQGGNITDRNNEGLYYCTRVRYLDLGHNPSLTDFGFIANMPELEIAIISMAPLEDLSPFANCPHLRYLEMGNTHVSDLSPLAACPELRHLNIGTNIRITDISPLYDTPLKRLWIGRYTPIPEEQVARMQELHPKCVIDTSVPSGLMSVDGYQNEGYTIGWKTLQPPLKDWDISHPIGWFKLVYKCFGYYYGVRSYSFSWNDPKYTGSDPYVKPVNVAVWDTSFLLEDWEDPHSDVTEELNTPPGVILYEFEH